MAVSQKSSDSYRICWILINVSDLPIEYRFQHLFTITYNEKYDNNSNIIIDWANNFSIWRSKYRERGERICIKTNHQYPDRGISTIFNGCFSCWVLSILFGASPTDCSFCVFASFPRVFRNRNNSLTIWRHLCVYVFFILFLSLEFVCYQWIRKIWHC